LPDCQSSPSDGRLNRFLHIKPRILAVLPAAIALCYLSPGLARAQVPLALRDGEQLVYRVGWGIIPMVGRITIAASSVTDGSRAVMQVTTTTSTRGIVRGFFPFDGHGESIFDANNGHLLVSSEETSYRDKATKTSMVFDYDKSLAVYTDDVKPAASRVIPLPAGDPFDLILGLVQTRSWTLKPGDQRDELVLFNDEFYLLTIHADSYEEVDTPLGTYHTLLLVPRMERTPPKGMFKRGSSVRVWISQANTHLPVRFEVEFKFGRGVATLVDYHPPKDAKPKEVAAGHAEHPGS